MGALSITHLLMALAIGVLVFAPKKLPGLMRSVRDVSSEVHDTKAALLAQADNMRGMQTSLEHEISGAIKGPIPVAPTTEAQPAKPTTTAL